MRSKISQPAGVRPLMVGTPHVNVDEPLVHRSAPGSSAPLEEALLHFDVEEDLAAIIPMPLTIPPAVRMAITKAACERFEFADELDGWLHAPDAGLGGRTPFEAIVEGEGEGVLAVLMVQRTDDHRDRRIVPLPGTADHAGTAAPAEGVRTSSAAA